MKKVLAVVLCLAVCFALTACSGNSEPSSSTEESLAPSSSAAEPSSAPEATATPEPESEPVSESEPESESASESSVPVSDDEAEAAIQEYLDSHGSTITDTVADTLDGTGMTLELLARGSALVYSFQYSADIMEQLDSEALGEALESSLDTTASTYESLLPSMKLGIPELESIIVEYLDADGNVLASRQFTESE